MREIYTEAVAQLQSLATERFGDVPTTTQATIWDDGDFDIRIFHTIGESIRPAHNDVVVVREQLRVSTADGTGPHVRHEVLRTIDGSVGAVQLYEHELPLERSPIDSTPTTSP